MILKCKDFVLNARKNYFFIFAMGSKKSENVPRKIFLQLSRKYTIRTVTMFAANLPLKSISKWLEY